MNGGIQHGRYRRSQREHESRFSKYQREALKMYRVLLVGIMVPLFAGTSAAQGSAANASRTLDVGTIVRVTTDTGQVIGQLAAPLKTDSAARVILFPCSTCALAQYPANAVRSLDVQTGSSRASHIGLGAVIGAGVGAAAGALVGSNGKWFGGSSGSATGPEAAAGGVLGLLVGTAIGAVLPVGYRWVRVLPAQ